MEDRLIESNLKPEDIFDQNIRPENLVEYVGQEKIKENLHLHSRSIAHHQQISCLFYPSNH